MPTKHLFTIGYEGMDIAAFISRLREAEVRLVVDVRELPLSRKKGFSKSAFREHLTTAGLIYSHVPELGCPRPIRNQYRSDSDWTRYTADFLSYLETQESRVRELARYSRSATACLVCYEADFNLCHRTYVAREAQRKGAPLVKHLTARTAFLDQPFLAAA